MFLDLKAGDDWGSGPMCQSCKQPIGAADATQTLHFGNHGEHRLAQMNGIYHSICARPYVSMLRALEALRGLSF